MNIRVASSSTSIVAICFRGMCVLMLALWCGFSADVVFGQQAKKNGGKVGVEDAKTETQQAEIIARLFAVVNELKSESDKPGAALLQSEIADVIWRFDEPAARSIFRLAFDTLRQMPPANPSTIDAKARSEQGVQSRRWTSAIKTIVQRYGLHDRKSAEAWLKDFESELAAERKTSSNSDTISQAQAELLAEMALGVLSQDPKEAQRLGLLALKADKIPTAFYRLLMALRSRDRSLSDVLWRQAFVQMRARGFKYDTVLVPLSNYAFFANGTLFGDMSPADVRLAIQYFVDAASALAARRRSGLDVGREEQASMRSFHMFLTSRALPIVALNSPDQLALLQNNIVEMTQGLSPEERLQSDMLSSMLSQRSAPPDGNDIESHIQRAEQEKNSANRNLLLRNLVLWVMRSDPEQALEVAKKIDDAEVRAQTEDDVYLVMLQRVSGVPPYEKARTLALKMNDLASRARWLTKIAGQISSRAADRTQALELLAEAYSLAAKSDNTPAKAEVLLSIAKEFVVFDRDRGFEILSDAIKTVNRLDPKAGPTANNRSGTVIRVMSVTVVNGEGVSTDDRVTLESINFKQIEAFVTRDYSGTSFMGSDLQDRLLRAKYFIALARSVLRVPRRGPGYERTLEDMLSR